MSDPTTPSAKRDTVTREVFIPARYENVEEPVVTLTMSERAAKTMVTLLNSARITDLDPEGDLSRIWQSIYNLNIRVRHETTDGEMTYQQVADAVRR